MLATEEFNLRRWQKMERSASPLRFLILSALAAAVTGGCSGSSNGSHPASVQVLDPTQPHYGHTDDEWGAQWFTWINELRQTDANNCIIPYLDPTGTNCGYGQSGDVFFLAGTGGGTVVRDQCVVPSGKAIFFPIVNFDGDNAGVPAAMQLSDTDLVKYVQNELDTVPITGLSAEFDGVPITNLSRFGSKITKFSYTLPPEPNLYTCQGQTGVTGLIDPSYAAGFYVMLAPPLPGSHTLHFAGNSPQSTPPLMLDVTYHLTIK
jgi:hypothetical protein